MLTCLIEAVCSKLRVKWWDMAVTQHDYELYMVLSHYRDYVRPPFIKGMKNQGAQSEGGPRPTADWMTSTENPQLRGAF